MRKDLWDPIWSRVETGHHVLTSVEITVTNQCNLRCEHCAVGDLLTVEKETPLKAEWLIEQLDQVPALKTLSITGGEPSYSVGNLESLIIPILSYAKERGLQTQMNTNLTLETDRYLRLMPYIDVFHISYNYLHSDDFRAIAFDKSPHPATASVANRLYDAMKANIERLSREGAFVSAETIITDRTMDRLGEIHQLIASMGVQRHEIHPLYPSDFARSMRLLSLDELRSAIHGLLDKRKEGVWILFGTLPFFWCSSLVEDQLLLARLAQTEDVTVRNDPDGRNRLNINGMTGDLIVQDFNSLEPVGNLHDISLIEAFERWQEHPVCQSVQCFCPEVHCTGPNLIVVDSYYSDVDFRRRRAITPSHAATELQTSGK